MSIIVSLDLTYLVTLCISIIVFLTNLDLDLYRKLHIIKG